MVKNFIAGAKSRVKSFRIKKDGTYDAITGKEVVHLSGYQFSFVRPEAFELLDENSWDKLTEHILTEVGGSEYIGVYDGDAETSFWTREFQIAQRYAIMFNQETILDWSKKEEDLRRFIINPLYKKEERVNYDKIINAIRKI